MNSFYSYWLQSFISMSVISKHCSTTGTIHSFHFIFSCPLFLAYCQYYSWCCECNHMWICGYFVASMIRHYYIQWVRIFWSIGQASIRIPPFFASNVFLCQATRPFLTCAHSWRRPKVLCYFSNKWRIG